jgi:RNA polymerase sigma-70 factor (ECF subfamily)
MIRLRRVPSAPEDDAPAAAARDRAYGPAGETARARDELAPLAAAVVRREADAVRTFVMATAGFVRRSVRMVLGAGHPEVDDVTQDAMIELLQALPRFRGDCTVARFAGRVGLLAAMAARRRRGTRERWVVHDEPAEADEPPSPEASPLAHAEALRRRQAVRQLLDELPDAIAETLALYYILGHTVPEIAAAAQIPTGTVASRLRIGKEHVRRRLAHDATLSEVLDVRGDDR